MVHRDLAARNVLGKNTCDEVYPHARLNKFIFSSRTRTCQDY